MQLDRRQRQEALVLIEGIPWGDMDEAIRILEEVLDRVLDATAAEFPLWEAEGEDRYIDECSVSAEDVAEMSAEWRLAYIGRLVRSLALWYGVSTGDFGDDPPLLVADANSPGGLLRALNDVVAMPVTDGGPRLS
jgi:hypothetical protein